jgi:DNA segregation ATPase FtsK/SpoIIIE, S-DNA-T family
VALFDHMSDERRRQLIGVLLLFLGLLIAVSLGTHVYFTRSGGLGPDVWTTHLGVQNRQIANWMFDLLGIAAWVIPTLLVMWGWNRARGTDPERLALRSVFLTAVAMTVIALVSLVAGGRGTSISGVVGAFIADLGTRHIGKVGTFLAGVGILVAVTLLTTEFDIEVLLRPFERAAAALGRLASSLGAALAGLLKGGGNTRPKAKKEKTPERAPQIRVHDQPVEAARAVPAADLRRPPPREDPAVAAARPAPKRAPAIMEASRAPRAAAPRPRPAPSPANFRLPPLSLLDDPPETARAQVSREELLARSKLLEEKLADFGVVAAVTQVHPGPIITRFEIEPARGVKVSQIAHLQDDLALAMKATAIRIIAPIPGRGAVGIEIPNEHPASVYLKDILASEPFQQLKSEIPLSLGKDTTGRVYCSDLAKMPHLLVAGATGSGKSICLNALLTGILFRSTPEQVRFLLIDPKRLELPRYSGIPHLIAPVVTDPKPAGMALQWLVGEMDRRYDILSALTVRDIYGFNERIASKEDLEALPPDDRVRLPHIVVVVDEFADLMLRAPRDVEAPVQRLAQMARAVGIHLVFATQRPSVDVITGVIKANFASRIAFRVISMTDSRTVLDRNGAETLLGSGDMLFLPTGKPDPIRLHGAYISNEETARLVSYLRRQGAPAYLFDFDDQKGMAQLAASKEDELYDKALEIVVGTQMGSTSLLQRRLSIGYARAGRLMDILELNGVVGAFKGSKCRDVLVGPEYLETAARRPEPPVKAAAKAHIPPDDVDEVFEDEDLPHEEVEEEPWSDDHEDEEVEEEDEEGAGTPAVKKPRPRSDDEDEYEEEDVTYDDEDDEEEEEEEGDDGDDHER